LGNTIGAGTEGVATGAAAEAGAGVDADAGAESAAIADESVAKAIARIR